MTVQIQEQKSFAHIYKWAREQLQKSKSEIILETAHRLEQEGCEPSKISIGIITNLKDCVDESYVRKVLTDYPQFKDPKQRANAKSGRNIPPKPTRDEGREPIKVPEDKVTVERFEREALEQPTVATIVTGPQPQLQQQQPNKTLIEQPRPTEVQGYHNIAPREYRVEELDQYDKGTLIEVVKYLHKELTKTATTGTDIERHLPEENDKLKKEKECLENVIKHYHDIFVKYQVGAGLAAMQEFENQKQ
jgi:hypothetical protein